MSSVYIQGAVSPLTKIFNWEKWLAKYPDPDFAEFIQDGIHEGFRIGFQKRVELKGASQNLPSASQGSCDGVYRKGMRGRESQESGRSGW